MTALKPEQLKLDAFDKMPDHEKASMNKLIDRIVITIVLVSQVADAIKGVVGKIKDHLQEFLDDKEDWEVDDHDILTDAAANEEMADLIQKLKNEVPPGIISFREFPIQSVKPQVPSVEVFNVPVTVIGNIKWDVFADEDMNGATYQGTQEGEVLTIENNRLFLIPNKMKLADTPLSKNVLSSNDFKAILILNAFFLNQNNKNIGITESLWLGYIRALAVSEGLVNPNWDPNDYYVDYNECVYATKEQMDVATAWFDALTNDQKEIRIGERARVRATFSDRVCLLAHVFRVRGHHYLGDYEATYDRIWKRCRYEVNDLHCTFQNMYAVGLHAIFPVHLDEYYTMCVNQGLVNGALVKRYDSAPAGVAGVAVIKQGIEDLKQIAPGVDKKLKEPVEYLDKIVPAIAAHRFAGSVNHRYYGVERVRVDEKKLASAASVILSCIEGLSPNDPLGNSAALQRIAKGAPITGAILSRAIGNLAQREEVILPLLTQ